MGDQKIVFKSLAAKYILWLSEQTGWQEWPEIAFQVEKLKAKLTPEQALLSRRPKGLSPAPPHAESAEDLSSHLILYLATVSVPAPVPDLELISLRIYG